MWQTPTGTVPYEYATFSVDDDRDDKMMFFEKMPSVCLNYDTFYTEKSLAMDITGDSKVYFSISIGAYIYPYGSYLRLVYDVNGKESTGGLFAPTLEPAVMTRAEVQTNADKQTKIKQTKKDFLNKVNQNNFYLKQNKLKMMETYGHEICNAQAEGVILPSRPPKKKRKKTTDVNQDKMTEILQMIASLKEKVDERPITTTTKGTVFATDAPVGIQAVTEEGKAAVLDKFTAFNMFSQMGLRLGRNNLEMYDTTTLQPVVKYMTLMCGVERFINNRFDFDEMELFGLYDGQEGPPFGASGKGVISTTAWHRHYNRFSPRGEYRLTMNIPFKYLSDFFCGHSLLLPMFLIRMEFTQSELWKRVVIQRAQTAAVDPAPAFAHTLHADFSMNIVRSECYAVMYAFIVDADVASTLEDEAERGVGTPYYYTYHSVLEKDHIAGTSMIHQSIVETSTSVPPILTVGFIPTSALSGDVPAIVGGEVTKVGQNSSIFTFLDLDATTVTLNITNPFPQMRTYELKSIAQRFNWDATVVNRTGNRFAGYDNVELYADYKHMAIHGRADYNGYPLMKPGEFGITPGNPLAKRAPILPMLPNEQPYAHFDIDHVGTNNFFVFHLSPNGPLEQWNISAVFDGKVEIKMVLAQPLPVDVRMVMVLSFPRLGMFQGSREVLTDPTFLHKQALSSVNDGGPHTREGYR